MHKDFAQLKNFSICNFEGYGFNTLYCLLEEDDMSYDLYILQTSLGYDVHHNQFEIKCYLIGNSYFGCGEDGFDSGDGECYYSDLILKKKNNA